jgi:hypothetical protein
MVPATMTPKEADFVESATLVAAKETVYGVGAVGGAVYKPEAEIVPRVVFPPIVPLTDHETDEL